MRSRAAGIVFLGYLVVLGCLVLSPTHPEQGFTPQIYAVLGWTQAHPLTGWVTIETLNDIANALIFLPFGLVGTLALGGRRWWLVALVGCTASFAAEGAQALFLPGRVVDIQDAISGSVGGIIGALVGLAITRRSAARTKRRHSLGAER